MIRKCVTSFLFFIISLIISVPLFAGETIRYNGSSTLLNTVMKPLTQKFSIKTGTAFDLQGKDTGLGIKELVNGNCDIAGAGRKPKDKEQKLANGDLVAHLIAIEGIGIIVNTRNPLQNLSTDQLRDIMSGKISDWKEVGWGDGSEIIIVSSPKNTSNYEIFTEKILGEVPFKNNAIFLPATPLVPEEVGKYSYAISFCSLSLATHNSKVKVISLDGVPLTEETLADDKYKIEKKYYLVTKGKPASTVGEFIKFCIGPEGQDIIESEGYFKIK